MILTERDAVRLAEVREDLVRIADSCTGRPISRRIRNRVSGLVCDIDAAFVEDLVWCHADTMPTVVRDQCGSWAVCCESCGAKVSRDTYEDVCDAWNRDVEEREGSE